MVVPRMKATALKRVLQTRLRCKCLGEHLLVEGRKEGRLEGGESLHSKIRLSYGRSSEREVKRQVGV